ncbi:hypothetical protein RDI58_001066 [Solanum bulbocastanum]|uniref:Uncharacterized protein n=1 Tax=Solanum bulbocastanum TaxID=147425 RepID=A0AAN8YSY0_SOLBU
MIFYDRPFILSSRLGCYLPSNGTDMLGCHLIKSHMLYSNWIVHLSKRYAGLSPRSK